MNRRSPCRRMPSFGVVPNPGFVPGSIEVLDQDDVIEVLVRSRILSAHTYDVVRHDARQLALLLLDERLVCLAVITVDGIPDPLEEGVIEAVARIFDDRPPEVEAIVLVMCSPTDPAADCDDVEYLCQLCEPLAAVGIELRDVMECYPSGFSSLRADLVEHEARRW
jgi:hypothetical protein